MMNAALWCILMVGYNSITYAMDLHSMMKSSSGMARKISNPSTDGSPRGTSETNSVHSMTSSDSGFILSPPISTRSISSFNRLSASLPTTPVEWVERGKFNYKNNHSWSAIECFKNAAHQNKDLIAAAWGSLYVGDLYWAENNLNAAAPYAVYAAKQKHDNVVVCKAAIILFRIHNERKNAVESFKCLEYVTQNAQVDPMSTAEANVVMGIHYQEGEGVPQNNDLAHMLYERAAKQDDHPLMALAARLGLCDMAYNNKMGDDAYANKNKIALGYCQEIIDFCRDYIDTHSKQFLCAHYNVKACLRRAVLYAEGGFGIEKNIAQAQRDIAYVLRQHHHPESARIAEQLVLNWREFKIKCE